MNALLDFNINSSGKLWVLAAESRASIT